MGAPVATLISRTRSIPAIRAGLERLGYQIAIRPKEEPAPDDLLVLWNRLPTHELAARSYEIAGARVVVFEHSWIGREGVYACCLEHHNGAGIWHVGQETRWPSFGIDVKPWRRSGEHVLVIPQRGMGVPPVAMPRWWTTDIVNRLSQATNRPIVIRHSTDRIHPLEPAFKDAHAIVTWASGGGVKAILNGYPVFYEMPHWIGAYAAINGIGAIEFPYLGERDTFLHRMSWAMWTADEIEDGTALKWLLK